MGLIAQWLESLQALLPPGQALTREPDSNLTKLLSVFAAMFTRAQETIDDAALQASDPLLATGILPEWESLLGLPDTCTANLSLTITDRQRLASQRLLETGGQSPAHFIDLAEQLGEPGCTVDEFRMANCNSNCNTALYSLADVFTWRLNIPHAAANTRAANCNGNCNDALTEYTPSLVECPINERKPAHTTVIFGYQ